MRKLGKYVSLMKWGGSLWRLLLRERSRGNLPEEYRKANWWYEEYVYIENDRGRVLTNVWESEPDWLKKENTMWRRLEVCVWLFWESVLVEVIWRGEMQWDSMRKTKLAGITTMTLQLQYDMAWSLAEIPTVPRKPAKASLRRAAKLFSRNEKWRESGWRKHAEGDWSQATVTWPDQYWRREEASILTSAQPVRRRADTKIVQAMQWWWPMWEMENDIVCAVRKSTMLRYSDDDGECRIHD